MRNAKRVGVVALAVGMIFLPACASKQPDPAKAGITSVEHNVKALETSAENLEKAQAELTSFQGKLKELREDMKVNEGLRTREQAIDSLNRLSINVDQARLDLRELSEENRLATEDLNRRLKDAATENRAMMQQGSEAPRTLAE